MPHPSSIKRTGCILGASLGGALLGAMFGGSYYAIGEHNWIFKNRANSTVGATEDEARRVMGPPDFVIRKADPKGRSLDFPWEGMHFQPIPTRPVTNKVLLYQSAWSAAYVFIGPNGRVEAVETAGT